MTRRLMLQTEMRPGGRMASEDLGRLKWAFSRLGLFDPARDQNPSELRMSPNLARALRVFQAGQGLREDARLRPRGPTESRVNLLLSQGMDLRSPDAADQAGGLINRDRQRARERGRGALAGRVGLGLENHPDDVNTIGSVLRQLGHIRSGAPVPPSTGAVFDGLKSFQRATGLKRDGIIAPDGPTELLMARTLTERRPQEPGNGSTIRSGPGPVGAGIGTTPDGGLGAAIPDAVPTAGANPANDPLGIGRRGPPGVTPPLPSPQARNTPRQENDPLPTNVAPLALREATQRRGLVDAISGIRPSGALDANSGESFGLGQAGLNGEPAPPIGTFARLPPFLSTDNDDVPDINGDADLPATLGDDDLQAPLPVPDPNDPEEIRAARVGETLKGVLRRLISQIRSRSERREPPNPGPEEKLKAGEVLVSLAKQKLEGSPKPKIRIEFSELGDTINPEAAIEQFVKVHREGRLIAPRTNQIVQLGLGQIDAENIERILDATSIDVSGFHRIIDTQGITHAFGSHGPGNETRPDQQPISPEAVSLYLDVVNDSDQITFRPQTKFETATIEHSKRIDGHIIVVEEIRTGKATLAFRSMFIKESN